HAHAACAAAGGAGRPRRVGAVPEAAGTAGAVRRSRASLRAQHLPQRRGHPSRRCPAHGSALNEKTPMLKNTRTIRVEWGDCDPAGIVFYPRYFEMFEACIAALFERATGMTKFEMLKAYDFAGYPVVEARAQFLAPAKYGDDVIAETTISEFRRSSFDV